MAPKLYGFTGNPRTNSARVVAEYEGINVDFVEVDVANKPKEFTDKFPVGLMPALEDDGAKVFETLAVAYHLASKSNKANLFGKTEAEKAQVLQWASFANSTLMLQLAAWFRPIVVGPYNKKASEDGKAAAAKLFGIVDQYLADHTFLVGERVTYADILLGATIQRGCDHVIDAAYLNQFPNVTRFFNTIQNQPAVLKVTPSGPKPIAQPKEYVPEKKKAAEKPAAAPAAAAAAPKKKAEKPAADDDDDEPKVEEPKAKHPCEALGKPTLALDEWKRQYSNLDTPDALKWFSQNYKPEEYSIYEVTYKFPEDLTIVFMSSNLITGFHSRLEASRKYLFGSCCVYGENNNSQLHGVYMCRGQDWEPVFQVGPDWESWEFKKLDYSNSADRELIEKNWQWEDEVKGLKVADGKVFK